MDNKLLKPSEVDCVIYHSPCVDGFASALVMWKYSQINDPEGLKKITFIPASYHQLPVPDVTGKNVLICDFSYKKGVLLSMIQKAKKLLVIDHHKSAENELTEIDDQYKVFDMNHSGAVLTWSYFFPDQPVPLLLQYIEDRDIWKKHFPDGDAFVAWFYTLPFQFDIYNEYLNDEKLKEMILVKGNSFQELNAINIKQSSMLACPVFCKIAGRYYFVAYLNSTGLKSDIGHEILNLWPYIDFSVVYSLDDRNNTTSFSLRSTDKHVDVSHVSTLVGGGGHRNASGVKIHNHASRLPSKQYDIGGSLYKGLASIYFQEYKEYRIVYMISSVCQNSLGKYLLQTKYKNKKGEDVQEAVAIHNFRTNKDENFLVHMSVVLSYDGHKDTKTHVINYHDSLTMKQQDLLKGDIAIYTECIKDSNNIPLNTYITNEPQLKKYLF